MKMLQINFCQRWGDQKMAPSSLDETQHRSHRSGQIILTQIIIIFDQVPTFWKRTVYKEQKAFCDVKLMLEVCRATR